MTNKTFGTNWISQKKLPVTNFWPPVFLFNTYQAHIKNISFTYPINWIEGINIWNEIDNNPVNYELGYVSTPGWQTGPNSPIGIWFFIGDIPMPISCNPAVTLSEIISMTPVKIKGLNQKIYFCETLATPNYDKTKFIANGGLVSIYSPTTKRFSLKDYLVCHPLTDDWFVYDAAHPQEALFQFGMRSFGLIKDESEQAFSSKTAALDFFKTDDYKIAKNVLLSTTIN